MSRAQDRYKYDNPYFQPYSHDKGDSVDFGGFNPRDGSFSQQGSYAKSLTPQEAATNEYNYARLHSDNAYRNAENAYRNATLAENARQFDNTLDYNREGRAWEQGYKERVLAQSNQPKYELKAGGDGKWYFFDPRTGEMKPVLHNGEHLDAPNDSNTSAAAKYLWSTYNAQAKDIQNEINQIEKRIQYEYRDNEKQKLEAQKAELIKQLKEKREQMETVSVHFKATQSSMNSQPTSTIDNNTSQVGKGMDIGANMLGVKKADITTEFNAPRKKKDGTPYNHAGVDYAMTKNTPIRLDDVGTVMRVTNVANQPGGYGNYVDIEGEMTDKNGKKHKIGMRFAHMGNGTVNVKKGQELRYGDLIGKVGNTGNAYGPNGGYHLHLETTIDGKGVDPTTFKGLISQYIPHTKNLQPNTFSDMKPNVTPFDIRKGTLEGRKQETTAAYRNPTTNDEVSLAEIEALKRKYADNPDELSRKLKELEDRGYVPTENNSTVTQAQPATEEDKFQITEQPSANATSDFSSHYSSLPQYLTGNTKEQPKLSGTASIPTNVASNPFRDYIMSFSHNPVHQKAITPPVNLLGNTNINAGQGVSISPSPEEEADVQEAFAHLDNQFSAWDNAFRKRYPFDGTSDFWRG